MRLKSSGERRTCLSTLGRSISKSAYTRPTDLPDSDMRLRITLFLTLLALTGCAAEEPDVAYALPPPPPPPPSAYDVGGQPMAQPGLVPLPQMPTLPPPAETYSTAHSASARTGGITVYSGDVSGTSLRAGSTTFHNLQTADGGYVQGATHHIGNVELHSFQGSDGTYASGMGVRVGSTTFHNINGSDGSYTHGTSQQVGGTTFHNYSGSAGTYSGTTSGW